jgi:hypothetical protein
MTIFEPFPGDIAVDFDWGRALIVSALLVGSVRT